MFYRIIELNFRCMALCDTVLTESNKNRRKKFFSCDGIFFCNKNKYFPSYKTKNTEVLVQNDFVEKRRALFCYHRKAFFVEAVEAYFVGDFLCSLYILEAARSVV